MTPSQQNPQREKRAKEKSHALHGYEEKVRRELRVLIAQKNLRLKAISFALEARGIRESEKGLSAKLAAGTFSAAYYIAIKEVIEEL